jgi:hypothetical protein
MTLVKLYPARFISPVVSGLALISVMIHAGLLEALRDNIQSKRELFLLVENR